MMGTNDTRNADETKQHTHEQVYNTLLFLAQSILYTLETWHVLLIAPANHDDGRNRRSGI
jgi:hypothetical protein